MKFTIENQISERGILTIATGSSRFINMAISLAKSIDLNSPGWEKAVITDHENSKLSEYYDHVIYIDEELPTGFTQKLKMYDYSPFNQTLWVDSDSLVINSIELLFESLSNTTDVSCIGVNRSEGKWVGVDINRTIRKLGIPYLVIHNGGVYYFRKSSISAQVFEKAKEFLKLYENLGFYKLRGKTAHEPLMSSAMAFYNMKPIDDSNKGMRTFIDISSELKIDILKRTCEFYEFDNQERRLVNPVIAHFSGAHADWFHYRRETAKLNIFSGKPKLGFSLVSFLVNLLYNPAYIMFMFFYRLMKFVFGKGRCKIYPLMPTLRYK